MSTPERLIEKLASEVAGTERKLTGLAARIRAIGLGSRRLEMLRRPDDDLVRRIDVLHSILQPERVIDSIRAAVENAAITEHPVRHMVIPNVLPGDAYDAFVHGIPAADFFDEEDRSIEQLLVRTSPMPVDAMVTWMFVTDVAAPALAAAVMARAGVLSHHRHVVMSPRLVRRRPGYLAAAVSAQAAACVAVLNLAQPHDTSEYGSRLHGASGAVDIPFHRNSAVVVFGPGDSLDYASIPEAAGPRAVRDTYQFGGAARTG